MKNLNHVIASIAKQSICELVLVAGLFLVACSGEDGSSAPRPDDDSSVESSSSSVTPKSNDSETSVSSSSFATSSSSAALATPCKTETEDNCEYGELVDDRDGQTYKTVKIGDQWWMAENLNYAYLQPTKTLDSSSFCYNDSASYCEKYGRLYLWSTAMDSAGTWSANGKDCGNEVECSPTYPVRGVCPEGWRLPSEDDWDTLIDVVGGQSVAGAKLKSTSGWNGSGNGTDAFGLSVLPAGVVSYDGDYGSEGYSTGFWSSTEYISSLAYCMESSYIIDNGYVNVCNKYLGYSVRCLKD
ncbi:fibrobacter succinogenes major paralogous domain-containing protein [Fibrobacter sp.]|uniref:fibrobacter succinogenes major paralogous domain-containing protein n=1 Tax=Fibrobacter sp. TaxID=35828 RepID=UPI003865E78C